MFPKKLCALGILDININLVLRKGQAEKFDFDIDKYNAVEDLESLFFKKNDKKDKNEKEKEKEKEKENENEKEKENENENEKEKENENEKEKNEKINYYDYISLSSDNNLFQLFLNI